MLALVFSVACNASWTDELARPDAPAGVGPDCGGTTESLVPSAEIPQGVPFAEALAFEGTYTLPARWRDDGRADEVTVDLHFDRTQFRHVVTAARDESSEPCGEHWEALATIGLTTASDLWSARWDGSRILGESLAFTTSGDLWTDSAPTPSGAVLPLRDVQVDVVWADGEAEPTGQVVLTDWEDSEFTVLQFGR